MPSEQYDSVNFDTFTSIIASEYGWEKGTDERTQTIYNIAQENLPLNKCIEFHLSLKHDNTGQNVVKFHFTVRVNEIEFDPETQKVVETRILRDAFKWYNIKGHNENAVFVFDEINGDTELFEANWIPEIISDNISRTDEYVQRLNELVQQYS